MCRKEAVLSGQKGEAKKYSRRGLKQAILNSLGGFEHLQTGQSLSKLAWFKFTAKNILAQFPELF